MPCLKIKFHTQWPLTSSGILGATWTFQPRLQKLSSTYDINIIVPQDSLLGPNLFLFLINDLARKVLGSLANTSADETSVYRITSEMKDGQNLAADINLDLNSNNQKKKN